MDTYILDENGNPKEEKDLLVWAKQFEIKNRIVARTKIGDSEISTVFLGLDHSFGAGAPILYETVIFGGQLDGEQSRYHTKKEALKGHEEMCEKIRERVL